MRNLSLGLILVLFFTSITVDGIKSSSSHKKITDDEEHWGYVEVRPKAHLFYWMYRSPYRVEDPSKPWPIILWLQGGPGASGVGLGNFQEIGPLDTSLKPRNSTWLKVADLLFVDNPVGTGFSYVDDSNAVVKSDEQAAEDLTTLLINLFKDGNIKSPLYLVAESYGGRYAVTTALTAIQAIKDGKLKLTLGGVVLGDSWISPEDFVFSWAPLLKDLSRLDNNGVNSANTIAEKIKKEISGGEYESATNSWSDLERVIISSTNSVDFYNFLLDSGMDPVGSSTSIGSDGSSDLLEENWKSTTLVFRRYSQRAEISTVVDGSSSNVINGADSLDTLMNGPIRKKLKIIPQNVTWGGQQDLVFNGLVADFMKPRINEVDELLSKGVNVTVYNGQLDLICSTKGAESWVEKLKWDGLKEYLSKNRTALYCGDTNTRGFIRSFKNFHFYWILGAGHFVPVDQPCLALKMAGTITNSPAKPS